MNYCDLNTIDFPRASFGDTTGTVSMVLATAMSSNTVKVSLVMRLLSNSTLAKMIMMSALVCSSQPIKDPSPGSYLSILPAKCVPINFPATEASNSTPAAMNTAAPPSDQLVLRPVLRKNTGITTNSTW